MSARSRAKYKPDRDQEAGHCGKTDGDARSSGKRNSMSRFRRAHWRGELFADLLLPSSVEAGEVGQPRSSASVLICNYCNCNFVVSRPGSYCSYLLQGPSTAATGSIGQPVRHTGGISSLLLVSSFIAEKKRFQTSRRYNSHSSLGCRAAQQRGP
jgi:hypothetical protein